MVNAINSIKMRSSQWLAGIAFYALACLGAKADAPVTGTIDLRQPANLKMIFDGGLRPYRLQGLESRSCVFDRSVLTIILPNASPFKFEADRGSINLLAGNDISSIDLFGLYTTVPEAVNLTKAICQAWGISSDGLDETVAHLGTKPGASQGWGQEFHAPQIRAQVIFKPMYYYDHVGAYVNVGFNCGNHFHGVKFLTAPIQPPPGYENVSMDAPPIKPSGRALPGMTWEQAHAQVQQQLTETTNQQPTTAPPPSPTPIQQAPLVTDSGIPWWVCSIVVLSLAIIMGLWYRSRPK